MNPFDLTLNARLESFNNMNVFGISNGRLSMKVIILLSRYELFYLAMSKNIQLLVIDGRQRSEKLKSHKNRHVSVVKFLVDHPDIFHRSKMPMLKI